MAALTDTSTLPAVVQRFWDRVLLVRALPAVVHGRVTQRRELKKRNGKVMMFRRMESLPLTVSPLVEGTPPTGRQLTKTDISVTIQQWGDYVPLTDLVQMTTDHPVLDETNKLLAEQSVRVVEALTRDVAAASTNKFFGGGVAGRANLASPAHKVDGALLDRINRALLAANASMFTSMIAPTVKFNSYPIRPAWIVITTPEVYFTLEHMPGWISVEEYGSQGPVMRHEVGAYRNFRVLVSTMAKSYPGGGDTAVGDVKSTGGLADVHTLAVFGQDAIAQVPLEGDSLQNIIKPKGSAGTADPLDQVGTSGWKHTGARIRLNEAFMAVAEVTVADNNP